MLIRFTFVRTFKIGVEYIKGPTLTLKMFKSAMLNIPKFYNFKF